MEEEKREILAQIEETRNIITTGNKKKGLQILIKIAERVGYLVDDSKVLLGRYSELESKWARGTVGPDYHGVESARVTESVIQYLKKLHLFVKESTPNEHSNTDIAKTNNKDLRKEAKKNSKKSNEIRTFNPVGKDAQNWKNNLTLKIRYLYLLRIETELRRNMPKWISNSDELSSRDDLLIRGYFTRESSGWNLDLMQLRSLFNSGRLFALKSSKNRSSSRTSLKKIQRRSQNCLELMEKSQVSKELKRFYVHLKKIEHKSSEAIMKLENCITYVHSNSIDDVIIFKHKILGLLDEVESFQQLISKGQRVFESSYSKGKIIHFPPKNGHSQIN